MRHTEQRPQVKVIGLSIRVQVTMVTNNNSNYEHNITNALRAMMIIIVDIDTLNQPYCIVLWQ